MLTTALAGLRAHAGRLLSSALAVAIAVAFVVAATALTASSQRSVLHAFAAQHDRAAAVVGPGAGTSSQEVPAQLQRAHDLLAARPGVAAVALDSGRAVQLLVPGRAGARDAVVRAVSPAGPLRWEQLASGRLPLAAGEVAVSERTGAAVGQVLTVVPLQLGDVSDATRPVEHPVTVTGVLDLGADPAAGTVPQVFATAGQVGAWGGTPGALRVAAAEGARGGAVLEDVRAALAAGPATAALGVRSGEESAQAAADRYTQGTAGVGALVLVFAVIAVLVAGLVIANTFAVVLAQRTRELALLRCVGASAAQVRRAVLLEAAVVGAVASAVGAAVGAALAAGASLVLGRLGTPVPLGAVVVPTGGLVLGVAVGTGVTVLAALVPARAAGRVPPVAALRPLDPVAASSPGGLARLGAGALLVSATTPFLLAGADLVATTVAGALSFLGVVLVAQRALPALIGLVGRLAAPARSVPAQLAAGGAVRHPRRTAATATALLVGVTLTATLVVGTATVRASAAASLDAGYPVDAQVSAQEVLPAGAADRVGAVSGVAAVTAVLSAPAVLGGTDVQVTGVDPADAAATVRSTRSQPLPRPGQVVVRTALAGPLGLVDAQQVQLTGDDGQLALTAVVAPGADEDLLVTAADLAALDADAAPTRLWVRLADGPDGPRGADADAQADAVDEVAAVAAELAPTATVAARAEERRGLDEVLDALLLVVTGLLGVAVLVAVLGVGATTALSVLERRQELGLLRALGLTRGQLGAVLVLEAALTTGVTALVGVGLGVLYAAVGTSAALGGDDPVHLVLPWTALVGIVAVGALAGALASLGPARRAARTPPVHALAG